MKLLEPIKVGNIEFKNRIMFPPLTTGYEEKDEKCTSKQQLMGKATPSNLKTSGTPAAKKKEASYALHHTTIN